MILVGGFKNYMTLYICMHNINLLLASIVAKPFAKGVVARLN